MEFILSKFVNQHTRRIIFVTSLFTRTSRLDRLQQSAVAKLNQVMVLASNDSSLPLASRLHNLVWRGTDLNSVLSAEVMHGVPVMTEAQLRDLSTRVVDTAPKYLRYGAKPDMIRDVFRLLTQSGKMVPATA
ncbi:hypothetical protein [Xanthomonas phage RTH11]|nr:hypothetical protein [Xanthomonas phage RTH11]